MTPPTLEERVMKWLNKPAKWWQFWFPQTGVPGGLVAGFIFAFLVNLVVALVGCSDRCTDETCSARKTTSFDCRASDPACIYSIFLPQGFDGRDVLERLDALEHKAESLPPCASPCGCITDENGTRELKCPELKYEIAPGPVTTPYEITIDLIDCVAHPFQCGAGIESGSSSTACRPDAYCSVDEQRFGGCPQDCATDAFEPADAKNDCCPGCKCESWSRSYTWGVPWEIPGGVLESMPIVSIRQPANDEAHAVVAFDLGAFDCVPSPEEGHALRFVCPFKRFEPLFNDAEKAERKHNQELEDRDGHIFEWWLSHKRAIHFDPTTDDPALAPLYNADAECCAAEAL